MSMSNSCYPYGALIECRCNNRGGIYACVPVMDGRSGGRSQLRGVQEPADYLDSTVLAPDEPLHRPADERTEIILAATFLVLVVLTFIAFMIYRCEKSFSRKKSQRLPSSYSTVSIQTEPSMTTLNGGGMVNGGIHTISNGAISTLPRYMNGGNHIARDLGDIDEQEFRMDLEGSMYRTRASLANVRTKDVDRSRESLDDPHQYRLKCEEILAPESPLGGGVSADLAPPLPPSLDLPHGQA